MQGHTAQSSSPAMIRGFSSVLKLMGYGFGGVMLLGAGLLAYGLYTVYLAYSNTDWPQTSGTIVVAEVVSFQSTTRDSNGRTRSETRYRPEVLYRYTIDGKEFQAKTIRAGSVTATGDPADAHRAIVNYTPSGTVPVFFNPKDPTDTVLETGIVASTWFASGFGFLTLAFGFGSWRVTNGIYNVMNVAESKNFAPEEAARKARYEGTALHQDLFGNWRLIAQSPSQNELLGMMNDNMSREKNRGADTAAHPAMTFSITEDELTIINKGSNSIGGPMTTGYRVEGDRLVLEKKPKGLLFRLVARYLPDYYRYRCHGSEMELTTNPIAAYNNQQIQYRLARQH